MVAQLIRIRSALGMRRQIYFVSAGGFDTHGNQLVAHVGDVARPEPVDERLL